MGQLGRVRQAAKHQRINGAEVGNRTKEADRDIAQAAAFGAEAGD